MVFHLGEKVSKVECIYSHYDASRVIKLSNLKLWQNIWTNYANIY